MNMKTQNVWDMPKAVLEGTFIPLITLIKETTEVEKKYGKHSTQGSIRKNTKASPKKTKDVKRGKETI